MEPCEVLCGFKVCVRTCKRHGITWEMEMQHFDFELPSSRGTRERHGAGACTASARGQNGGNGWELSKPLQSDWSRKALVRLLTANAVLKRLLEAQDGGPCLGVSLLEEPCSRVGMGLNTRSCNTLAILSCKLQSLWGSQFEGSTPGRPPAYV